MAGEYLARLTFGDLDLEASSGMASLYLLGVACLAGVVGVAGFPTSEVGPRLVLRGAEAALEVAGL